MHTAPSRLPLAATIVLALSLTLASCATPPPVSTEGLTAPEIIQRAQESYDSGFFENAIKYYTSIIDRFSSDAQYLCQAEYEIGFILYKLGRYEEAKAKLGSLLARYDSGPDARLLPSQFKILAEKVLKKVEEKLPK